MELLGSWEKKHKGFLTKPRVVSRSVHTRSSLPVDRVFVHVYQWLVKEIRHTTSTTNNTVCVMTTQRQENLNADCHKKRFPLAFYEKGQCFLQFQCNDNIMYNYTEEECMCP